MLKNVPIDKTDHVIALLIQPGRACPIILDLFCVRFPINFHHQPTGSAIEIRNDAPDGMLATEFEAIQLSIAQMCP